MKTQDKVKQHTIYKLKDGTRVCGVTTVTGILAKPQLIAWANRLGLDGIDSSKYTDDLAGVGSLTHEMIRCHLTGDVLDTSEYTKNDISRAENAFISYLNWEKGKVIKPILIETPVVSEKLQYGGTPDLYAEIDGVKTLVDFKTSSALYEDHLIQVAGGYKPLLEENGYPVEKVTVLRIGRTEDEGFEHRTLSEVSKFETIFSLCLQIYKLRRK